MTTPPLRPLPLRPDPASAIAARRRRYLDDAGTPVCPACGGPASRDGMRRCGACGDGNLGVVSAEGLWTEGASK